MIARGKAGEEFAAARLLEAGMEILAANFHSAYGEIDLIARDGNCIAFVEVKTRKRGAAVTGRESVTKTKQRRIITTALLYLNRYPSDLQPRFDVFSLVTDAQGNSLSWEILKGAFDASAYG